MKLTEISPRGVGAVFETLRSVLHGNEVAPRVQYMIEVMFAIRKDKFSVCLTFGMHVHVVTVGVQH